MMNEPHINQFYYSFSKKRSFGPPPTLSAQYRALQASKFSYIHVLVKHQPRKGPILPFQILDLAQHQVHRANTL